MVPADWLTLWCRLVPFAVHAAVIYAAALVARVFTSALWIPAKMINLRAKGGNGRGAHRAVLCGQALSVGQTRSTLSGGLSGWKGVRPTDTGSFCRSGESDGLFKACRLNFALPELFSG